MSTSEPRPPFIRHWKELEEPEAHYYKTSDETHSAGAPFGRAFGLTRIGIHHERLPPGKRTSWPHAESHEEEFVYVIEGTPDAWIDGHLHRLAPGDGVGFPAGTGIAHTFLNNTDTDVRLLVVGERRHDVNRIHYPMHPEYTAAHPKRWEDVPKRPLGPHDGLPDRMRRQ